jgi:hypothetical protein
MEISTKRGEVMNKRAISLLLILFMFMLFIILVPKLPSKSLPELDVYDGQLKFDGENAYRTLKYITGNFKDRTFGNENNIKCAYWIKEEFEKLGLKVVEEDFTTYGIATNENGMFSMGDLVWKSIDKNISKYKGKNIVAISEGREKDIILIGAHRDTFNTLEGAEDDGSGTAALIELARILSKEDHRYTYYFVSFDGEEYGLYGSQYLAEKYSNKPIKLAVSLDMLGWSEAEGVTIYPFITAYNTSELWTYALAKNVADNQRIPFIPTNWIPTKASDSIRSNVFGNIPTDTNGFLNKGIPVLGVAAAKKGNISKSPNIHSMKDTMKYISEDTLHITGRFTEGYLRSVEKIGFENMNRDRMYLTKGVGIISGGWIWGFFILAIVLIAFALKLYYDSLNINKSFTNILRMELPWIGTILLASLVITLYWQILRVDVLRNWPLSIHLVLWMITIALLIAIIVRFRNKYSIPDDEGMYINKVMIFFLTLIWSVITSLVFNPIYVFIITTIPLLITLVLSYKRWVKRILSYIVFIPMAFIYYTISTVPASTFEPVYLKFNEGIDLKFLLLTIPIFIWGVYFVSNPLVLRRR